MEPVRAGYMETLVCLRSLVVKKQRNRISSQGGVGIFQEGRNCRVFQKHTEKHKGNSNAL